MHDSNLAAESRYFEIYIQPLLKNPEKTRSIRYFFYQGWLGWRHSVQPRDLKRTKFVETLCDQLYKDHEGEFIRVLTSVLDEHNDAALRIEQAESTLFRALEAGEMEQIFAAQLGLYKTLFESDFRLHGTIPYFYLCKMYGKTHEVKDAEKFVDVAAGEKFQVIKNTKLPLPDGSFPDLVSGFDNQIRNAGAGHDRWEISDNSTMILKVVGERSGAEKGRREFSQKQFRDILQNCRINLWVLRNGLSIFLENNPEIEARITSKRVHKVREIENAANLFATNRNFEVKGFNLNNERTKLELTLKYAPPVVGRNAQIFFGSAEAYDIVNLESVIKYAYQMLDIVKCCLSYLAKDNLPHVTVHMFGENDEDYGTVEYEKDELAKLFIEEGDILIPTPSKGAPPEVECKIISPVRVPYGQGAKFEEILKKRKGNWKIN